MRWACATSVGCAAAELSQPASSLLACRCSPCSPLPPSCPPLAPPPGGAHTHLAGVVHDDCVAAAHEDLAGVLVHGALGVGHVGHILDDHHMVGVLARAAQGRGQGGGRLAAQQRTWGAGGHKFGSFGFPSWRRRQVGVTGLWKAGQALVWCFPALCQPSQVLTRTGWSWTAPCHQPRWTWKSPWSGRSAVGWVGRDSADR